MRTVAATALIAVNLAVLPYFLFLLATSVAAMLISRKQVWRRMTQARNS